VPVDTPPSKVGDDDERRHRQEARSPPEEKKHRPPVAVQCRDDKSDRLQKRQRQAGQFGEQCIVAHLTVPTPEAADDAKGVNQRKAK
jgi:hypothetical protein